MLEDRLVLSSRPPKFVMVYGQLGAQIEAAVEAYVQEVRARAFPTEDQVYR